MTTKLSIRSAFVCDPGHLLVVADYDQIELRCAAALSGDPEMIRVFQEGLDIHAEATSAMLQKPVEDVTKSERQLGKTVNFGTLYGAGAWKIAQTAGVSEEEAQEFLDLFDKRFAGLAAWKASLITEARKNGEPNSSLNPPYVSIPPFGRRRRLVDLWSVDKYARARAERQVVNSVVQGFAAYIMKMALIDLYEAIKRGAPVRMLLTVHDELVTEGPVEQIEEVRDLVVSTMEGVKVGDAPILGPVPLTADAKIAPRWSEGK